MAWMIEQESGGRWLAVGTYPSEEEAREHAQALRSLMEMGKTPDAAVRTEPLPTPEEATDPAVYARLCEAVGTRDEVAALTGTHRVTISGRCNGHARYPIDMEAARAILHIHLTERG